MKRRLVDIVLAEGKFGPGSETQIKTPPTWKGKMGTVENKRRPESIYIIISTWVTPKLSLVKASELAAADKTELAVNAAQDFEVNLKRFSPKIKGFFDSLYFDLSTIIFTYDFAGARAQVGKSQFLEIEINIDTVNAINSAGQPAANPKTGKVEHIHFDAFKKPVETAVSKILSDPMFARSAVVDFQKTKKN